MAICANNEKMLCGKRSVEIKEREKIPLSFFAGNLPRSRSKKQKNNTNLFFQIKERTNYLNKTLN